MTGGGCSWSAEQCGTKSFLLKGEAEGKSAFGPDPD